MKYVCLGFISAAKYEALSEAEGRQLMEECFAYDDELRRGGHFLGGEALQPAQNAVTLRIKNGSVEVTDGPYAETKEMLGGILFLEAHDLNHAISLMSRHPGVRVGPFEIRPADEGINQRIADLNANHKHNRELQLDSPPLRNQRENSQSSPQSSNQRHVTPRRTRTARHEFNQKKTLFVSGTTAMRRRRRSSIPKRFPTPQSVRSIAPQAITLK
jgi:hypothetical protein